MKAFQGVIPPLITPLQEDGTLDVRGLERLIDHVLRGGVHGVFVLGTTGEGPALSAETQHAVFAETVRIINGRVPVLAGVSSASFSASAELAAFAAKCGADAIVSAPPCYFMPEEQELYDYFRNLAGISALPLFIYNMPAQTKVYIKPELMCRLAEIPNVCGCKDSSGNMFDFHEVLLRLSGNEKFSIFIGPEEFLGESVLFGADGCVSAGANLHPEIFTGMYDAALRRDIDAMKEFQKRIYRQRRLYSIGKHQQCLIKSVKILLEQQNICKSFMALPGRPFSEADIALALRLASEI